MIDNATKAVRAWIAALFAAAIVRTTRSEDRSAAVLWLGRSREIIASDARALDKARQLNGLVDSKAVASTVLASVAEAVQNYRHSKLPLSVKIAIPATLAAMPLVGAQGAGLAAFGGAIGVPVLLLIFLGTAGITSIIESVITHPESRTQIADIIDVIIADERLRRASAEMKAAMRAEPESAQRQSVPTDDEALRNHLLTMDPFIFEQHVMSFFSASGLEAWVTRRSNDMGVDGFAIHADGPLIVQCKRNAANNKVGRPMVQQFKGVVEEQHAVRGYIVTTAEFTDEARHRRKCRRSSCSRTWTRLSIGTALRRAFECADLTPREGRYSFATTIIRLTSPRR